LNMVSGVEGDFAGVTGLAEGFVGRGRPTRE
jgi:hypothetical protein